MTNDEVMQLSGKDNPVLCADGKMGMLIRYPVRGAPCGIQVYGEKDIRRVNSVNLIASTAGALRQLGSPPLPIYDPINEPAQMLLAMDWQARGGLDL